MDEVWNDINLTSDNIPRPHHHPFTAYRPTHLQDFLARPFSASNAAEFHSSTPAATSAGSLSGASRTLPPSPPPATILSLNSGAEFRFLDHSEDPHPVGPPPCSAPHLNHGISSDVPPSDVLGPSSPRFLLPFRSHDKRFAESGGGARRQKRMIKNRESAARSRARKQERPSLLPRSLALRVIKW